MIDRPTEIGRCCGMDMNTEKTKVMRISRKATISRPNYNRSKTTGECGIFQLAG
jgi:hypothetical protein